MNPKYFYRIIWLLMVLFIISSSFAQDPKSSRELKKEASQKKKAEKEKIILDQYNSTGELLESRHFVLEAQSLSNKTGQPIFVNSSLNFVSVDSLFAVIQVGSTQRAGDNGVGGITAHGKISNWNLTKNDKKKMFDLFMTVNSNVGIYDIAFSIDYSGLTSATLTGLNSGRLSFNGNIIPLEESGVFKGQSH